MKEYILTINEVIVKTENDCDILAITVLLDSYNREQVEEIYNVLKNNRIILTDADHYQYEVLENSIMLESGIRQITKEQVPYITFDAYFLPNKEKIEYYGNFSELFKNKELILKL